jgi:broad specificity phosphatase PhoE
MRRDTHFFIIRHGQSEGNASRVFQGRLDLPLDEAGRAQARSLGGWLARAGIGEVVSSPLARAAETARIAASAAGAGEPALDPILQELDVGVFTGLTYEESRERYPAVFQAFKSASWDAVPGAESSRELYARAMLCWDMLRGRALAGDRDIACVSHGGFIQWLVRATFGCRSWMPLISTANCGIFELIVEPTKIGPAYVQWRRFNYQAPSAGPPPSAAPLF